MGRRTLAVARPTAAFVAVLVSCALPVAAQEETVTANEGNLSFAGSLTVANAYFFRGMPQENADLVMQPALSMAVPLLRGTEREWTVGLAFGTWNSVHINGETRGWYESDFYGGVGAELPAGVRADLHYAHLHSPRSSATFAEEIDLRLAWRAKSVFPDLPARIEPYVVLAQEVDGGFDAGQDLGRYLEVGVIPSVEIEFTEEVPLTISVPIALGLGLSNYYEDAIGNDDRFGFVDLSAAASLPLYAWIPPRFGDWTFRTAFHVLLSGDAAANLGRVPRGVTRGSKELFFYATVGLEFEY